MWLIPNAALIPRLQSYLVVPPPPAKPTPPGVQEVDSVRLSGFTDSRLRNAYQSGDLTFGGGHTSVDVYTDADAPGNHFAARGEFYSCEPIEKGKDLNPLTANVGNVLLQTPKPQSGSLSLAEVLITGRQTLDVKKQESDASEKQLRLYVQAGLTFLLAAPCLYLMIHKK